MIEDTTSQLNEILAALNEIKGNLSSSPLATFALLNHYERDRFNKDTQWAKDACADMLADFVRKKYLEDGIGGVLEAFTAKGEVGDAVKRVDADLKLQKKFMRGDTEKWSSLAHYQLDESKLEVITYLIDFILKHRRMPTGKAELTEDGERRESSRFSQSLSWLNGELLDRGLPAVGKTRKRKA